jgi:hypothetical protein
MAKTNRAPFPFKRAGVFLVGLILLIVLTIDFREIYLKSWMFELINPTHSVELNVSRVKR